MLNRFEAKFSAKQGELRVRKGEELGAEVCEERDPQHPDHVDASHNAAKLMDALRLRLTRPSHGSPQAQS